jgi:hypothetical protein
MQIGPGSERSHTNDETDSISYFERELAQTVEDSIHESIEEDDGDDQAEEDESECSD